MLEKKNKRADGSEGEEIAVKLLKINGYTILERNFRTRSGEIDIVAREGNYLCFVEVKKRADTTSGYPEEAITKNKINQIKKTALFYLSKNRISPDSPIRFDVLVILADRYKILRNAFDFS